MSSTVREQLNAYLQNNIQVSGNPSFISEPPIFSLVKFLQDQGFDDSVINTTAIMELNRKLMEEETRLSTVENTVIAQMHDLLQRLTTMLPATAPLAEIFVARNSAKFANCRNHTRQVVCQAALGQLPPPTKRSRPTEEAKAVLRQFWDAGNTHPNVDQRIMLACHAHLTFNQVSYWFSNQRNRGEVPSSSSSTSSTQTTAPRVRVKSKSTRDAERAAAAAAAAAATATTAATTSTLPPPMPHPPVSAWPPEPPAALPNPALNDELLLSAFQQQFDTSMPWSSSNAATTTATTEINSPTVSSPFDLFDQPSILKLLDDSALTNVNTLEAIDEAQSSVSSPTVMSPEEFRNAFAALNSAIFISGDDGVISEASDHDVVEMLTREHEFWGPSQ